MILCAVIAAAVSILLSSCGGPVSVDMGLSVRWASCNVGADSPDEAGDYFAWGETEPGKTSFSDETYDHTLNSKYADGRKTRLDREDDAAAVNMGGRWRMPTEAEIAELENNCTWEWMDSAQYEGNRLPGYLVTSEVTHNSIFLPAAGGRWRSDLHFRGTDGLYWSSELYQGSSALARYIHFSSGDGNAHYDRNRCTGFTVRAVCTEGN